MKRSRPMVSVIIPVYNGEAFLAEAIESVLIQSYRPMEVIVVDDGSTDGTAAVASRFKEGVRYIHQHNSGPAAARNSGLRVARGELIGFLDADDLWVENKLELQLGHLAGDLSVQIAIGLVQSVEKLRVVDGKHRYEKLSEPMVLFGVGSALFKRPVFDKVGVFDETLRLCEDWDWLMRARELAVQMLIHKDVTLLYRRHGENMTNQTEFVKDYFLRMLKKSIERRRQGPLPATSLPKLADFEEMPTG
jgi:glycosyltransferase involved in cell wall biosynthesis